MYGLYTDMTILMTDLKEQASQFPWADAAFPLPDTRPQYQFSVSKFLS